MRPSLEGGGDALRHTDFSAPTEVSRQIQFQLTGQADAVKAAHSFIQPTGGEAHLPQIAGLTGGSETATMQAAMKGGETVAAHAALKAGEGVAMHMAAHAGESGAMAAANQAGNQAINPLIQMIMRMPGHLGLVSSFFEVLGHFFMGPDLLGGLLDPNILHSIAHAASSIGEHLHLDFSVLEHPLAFHEMGTDSSIFHGTELATHGEPLSFEGADPNNLTKAMQVGGGFDLNRPMFEHSAVPGVDSTAELSDQKILAWDGGGTTFHPSMTASTGPDPSTPMPNMQAFPQFHQIMPSQTVPQPSPDAAATAPTDGGATTHGSMLRSEHLQSHAPEAKTESADAQVNGSQPGDAHSGADASADAKAGVDYTIKRGDNLWDIARHNLGNGSRWQEIYNLNHDALGANPDLIQQGVHIQLPGDAHMATDIVVKPGDNLWDLSKAHAAGGENWPQLYHANEGVIGSNPNLIHPGQHLTIDHSQQTQLADHSSHSAHLSSHHVTGTHAPHAAHSQLAGHHQHIAHSPSSAPVAHHSQPTHIAQSHSNHIAHTPHSAGSQTPQVPRTAQQPAQPGDSTAGQELALRAKAGSLDAIGMNR